MPTGVRGTTPSRSRPISFQWHCRQTRGACAALAQISQSSRSGTTCAGGRTKVSSTSASMEKPKPVAPRMMPATKTEHAT